MNENYYTAMKKKLMKGFDRSSSWFRPHLIQHYGQEVADGLVQDARRNYESLIPQIPYIGGAKVHMTTDLLESVLHLAYLRAFKARGISIEESRKIIFQGMETRLAQYPKLLLKLMGWITFTRLYLRRFQSQANESQKREYPDGFVFDVVIGDGKDFDWGLNFTECGIRKFYQAQNASEFLPILCPIDYALSDAFGYGLARTKTLAEGNELCNPRMKRGRKTEWRLTPEVK